jgi:ADP-heptose:LPS heptosyltransferase
MWFINKSGIGDEIAITAVVREYRRAWPDEKIMIDTPRKRDVFANNPHLLGGTKDKNPTVYLNQIFQPHEMIGPMPISYGLQARVPMLDVTPELWFTERELGDASNLLLAAGLDLNKYTVAIDVWAKWPSRRWPLPRWADVTKRCLEAGWQVVELGKTDYDDEGNCLTKTQHPPSTLSLHDQLSLRQTMAVMACMHLYLGNDSGLLHMAAACGVPAVGIYGPKPWYSRVYKTTYPVYAPMRCPVVCSNICTQPAHPCMAPVTVDQTWAAVLAARDTYKKQYPKVVS